MCKRKLLFTCNNTAKRNPECFREIRGEVSEEEVLEQNDNLTNNKSPSPDGTSKSSEGA